jgi:mannose/cellobiose epimerase-like protein (N-acyl-D-glucosamine 2-epimerase family)
MPLSNFNQTLTVAGSVLSIDEAKESFCLRARSGDVFEAFVRTNTQYEVLRNLDNVSRDLVSDPAGLARENESLFRLKKYLAAGRPVFVRGVYQENGGQQRFDARTVYLLHSEPSRYAFEETQWWLVQLTQMADRILDHLFDFRRNYTIDDFSKFYRTNLNILGQPINDNVQECATLSRLLYDLSTGYLITGADRYFLAARAAMKYLREAFRSLSHDGEHCFWAYGRRRNVEGEKGENLLFASQNDDDRETIPLYEQIYVLAGLTQYYRITLDAAVLEDIRRTLNSFRDFYWDPPEAKARECDLPEPKARRFAGTGGYYSHLHPATMRPDTPTLGDNCKKKNWNSIGDHTPAYLVNLILMLDPLPQGSVRKNLDDLLQRCICILEETSSLIIDKFPDPQSDFVNERFHDDWTPDHSYRWQKNTAVVGHNLKIAWNLTRCAHFFQMRAKKRQDSGKTQEAAADQERVNKCLGVARRLADRMAEVGLDQIRGGIFDNVERQPNSGMPTQFAWNATKDFWQQEQGILAYLILHGATLNDQKYLELARESSAFWNLFFLDREGQGYFFRVTENGLPVIEDRFGMKGNHAIGYHAFELSYLAHIYTRTFVAAGSESDNSFCMYFNAMESPDQTSINVLPDFMPPGKLEVCKVFANGVDVTVDRKPDDANEFQIALGGLRGSVQNDGMIALVVEFKALAPSA